MRGTPLPVLVEESADGSAVLRAPKVGVWSDRPADGALVSPGSVVGRLVQLTRSYALTIPPGVSGRIATEPRVLSAVPVGYGEILARVALLVDAGGVKARGRSDPAMSAAPLAAAITAPTDGMFYRRPEAKAAPYVREGEVIAPGRIIGLIEVMKTFNPIVYAAEAAAGEAVVEAILVADEVEVRAGQPLIALGAVRKP